MEFPLRVLFRASFGGCFGDERDLKVDIGKPAVEGLLGSFRKLGVPYFGGLIIRLLLFRVLY